MDDNVNTAFGAAALLAFALMPAISSAAEEPAAGVPNDPFIEAVFACHSSLSYQRVDQIIAALRFLQASHFRGR